MGDCVLTHNVDIAHNSTLTHDSRIGLWGAQACQTKTGQNARTPEQTAFARKLRRNTSKAERRLWPHLRSSQMGAPFRKQHPIDIYFADYCCVPLKLVVEVDGHTHSAARDSLRDRCMQQHGFDVLRFSVQELDENLEGVISTIHGAVQLRLLARETSGKAR